MQQLNQLACHAAHPYTSVHALSTPLFDSCVACTLCLLRALQLYVSPVKLVVGKGNLLSQIYRLLGLHGRFGSHGASPSHQHPWLSGSSSGSTTAAAAAKEAAAAADDDGAALQGLEVWSGPLRVQLEGPGKFRTDRVDMLLGGWLAPSTGVKPFTAAGCCQRLLREMFVPGLSGLGRSFAKAG